MKEQDTKPLKLYPSLDKARLALQLSGNDFVVDTKTVDRWFVESRRIKISHLRKIKKNKRRIRITFERIYKRNVLRPVQVWFLVRVPADWISVEAWASGVRSEYDIEKKNFEDPSRFFRYVNTKEHNFLSKGKKYPTSRGGIYGMGSIWFVVRDQEDDETRLFRRTDRERWGGGLLWERSIETINRWRLDLVREIETATGKSSMGLEFVAFVGWTVYQMMEIKAEQDYVKRSSSY